MNSSVVEIAEWAASNKLPINESKTKPILITGKGRLKDQLRDGLIEKDTILPAHDTKTIGRALH